MLFDNAKYNRQCGIGVPTWAAFVNSVNSWLWYGSFMLIGGIIGIMLP